MQSESRTNAPTPWTDEDSAAYQQIAGIAVPARAEQIATLLMLLPASRTQPFAALELGCGEGALTFALLDAFPRATAVALDGSEAMRATAARTLGSFADRVTIAPFDLLDEAWHHHLDGVSCILSSLCLHHLSPEGKQRLYQVAGARASGDAAFLIADLVEPIHPRAREVFAASWDVDASAQAGAGRELFERFRQIEWNHYRFPDPIDRPSPLVDQIGWLREAGFGAAECVWMRCGHAIYGGARRVADVRDPLSFDQAIASAQRALAAITSRP